MSEILIIIGHPDSSRSNANARIARSVQEHFGSRAEVRFLDLIARGFGGIPMLLLGLFADDIRRELGVSKDYKLLHGIAFGHPDWDAMQNKQHLGRVPIEESAVLHW